MFEAMYVVDHDAAENEWESERATRILRVPTTRSSEATDESARTVGGARIFRSGPSKKNFRSRPVNRKFTTRAQDFHSRTL
ncbi:MAG: hypothetical protein DMG01_02510 [Acidobacteria bacterium]|nr:MAG: hypothetical protein DMG01_02510 [Acidobacteriota bacterium]